jgi:hypothetical protein
MAAVTVVVVCTVGLAILFLTFLQVAGAIGAAAVVLLGAGTLAWLRWAQ